MSLRMHAIRVISRTRLKESLIQPGFYIATAIGLFLAFILQYAFSLSVGSGGFEPSLNRIFDAMSRVMTSMFGETFVDQMFSDGPYMLILSVSFIPVYFYAVIGSLFRSGMEKQVGAMALVTSGPADGISCYLAALWRDCIIVFAYLLLLLLAFLVGSWIHNLAITQRVLLALLYVMLSSVALLSYAVLLGVCTNGPVGAVTSHLGLTVVFGLVFVAKYALVGGGVRNVAAAIGVVLEWLSPFHYWKMGVDAAAMQRPGGVLLSLLALCLLSAILVSASHLILRRRGVGA